MAVIAMTREMGSGGRDVALGVADACDLTLVHHELVEHHVASRLQMRDSAVHRYLEGGAGILERWRVDEKCLARCTAEQIFELAERGNVIIRGWGAAQLLRGVSHVACVRVCAPMHIRVRRLMERAGLENASVARKEIKSNDAAHARIVRHLFKGDWRDPRFYDIVINTERTSIEDAATLVRRLLRLASFEESERSRARLAALRARAKKRLSMHGVLDTEETERLHHEHLKHHEFASTREDRDLLL